MTEKPVVVNAATTMYTPRRMSAGRSENSVDADKDATNTANMMPTQMSVVRVSMSRKNERVCPFHTS